MGPVRMAGVLFVPSTEATYCDDNYEEGEERNDEPATNTGAKGVHDQSEEVQSGGLAKGEQQEDEADESKTGSKRRDGKPSGSAFAEGRFAIRRPRGLPFHTVFAVLVALGFRHILTTGEMYIAIGSLLS